MALHKKKFLVLTAGVVTLAVFAARPSGTEDIYKIYAESFQGAGHLRRIIEEAQTIVGDAIGVSL